MRLRRAARFAEYGDCGVKLPSSSGDSRFVKMSSGLVGPKTGPAMGGLGDMALSVARFPFLLLFVST